VLKRPAVIVEQDDLIAIAPQSGPHQFKNCPSLGGDKAVVAAGWEEQDVVHIGCVLGNRGDVIQFAAKPAALGNWIEIALE
jgi:hypothetical protein